MFVARHPGLEYGSCGRGASASCLICTLLPLGTSQEFDAGIIANEMARCGMTTASGIFETIAREGLCTMDPQLGRWLREAWGEGDDNKLMNALSLKELVNKLLPEHRALLTHHHTAGVDALLHRKLAYALYGLGRAPCRLTAGSHERQAPREGGDVLMCTSCEERF